jgi:hypothetical protein
MAIKVLSASILVCERWLLEEDKVFSAIRIVDISYLPQPLPENAAIEINILATIKTLSSGDAAVPFALRLIDPTGKEFPLKGVPDKIALTSKFPDKLDIPRGTTIGLHLGIKPDPFGTYFLKMLVDGAEVATAVFTLLPTPATEKQS